MKDVFNMDETWLFYRLQLNHSLATKQLEGKKQDKERLTIVICYNKDGFEKFLYGSLVSMINHGVSRMWTWAVWTVSIIPTKEHWMTGFLFQQYVWQLYSKMDDIKIR